MYSINQRFPVRTDLDQIDISDLAEGGGLDRHFITLGRDMMHIHPRPHGLYSEMEMLGVINVMAMACENDTPFPDKPSLADCALVAGDTLSGKQWGAIFRRGKYRVLGFEQNFPYIDSFPGDDINIVSMSSIYGLIVAKHSGRNISIYINRAQDVWLSLTPAGKHWVNEKRGDMKDLISEHDKWVYLSAAQIILPLAKCNDILGHNLIKSSEDGLYDVDRESGLWFYCKYSVGGNPVADMLGDGYARYLGVPVEG